jgi:RNA polymerase primary sigma factor
MHFYNLSRKRRVEMKRKNIILREPTQEEIVIIEERYRLLVAKIARRHIWKCQLLEMSDLCQEGFFGLIEAWKRHDNKKGPFKNYASLWITAYILRAIIQQEKLIRIPTNILNERRRYQKVEERLSSDTKDVSNDEKITLLAQISPNHAKMFKKWQKQPPFARLHLEEYDILALIPSKTQTPLSETMGREILSIAKKCLKEKEFTVLELRIVQELTLQEIGNMLGVTRERIRQIEKNIISKIKKAL